MSLGKLLMSKKLKSLIDSEILQYESWISQELEEIKEVILIGESKGERKRLTAKRCASIADNLRLYNRKIESLEWLRRKINE